jgi:hypothetical protein
MREIKSRKMRWSGHIARIEEIKNAKNNPAGKSKVKRPLGRPNHEWEGNDKIDLREIRWKTVDWIHLPQDRGQWRALLNTVMNFRVP